MLKYILQLKLLVCATIIMFASIPSHTQAQTNKTIYDPNALIRLCSYDASPQGFGFAILKHPTNTSKFLRVYAAKPMNYSAGEVTSMNAPCPFTAEEKQVVNSSCKIGTQNTGNPFYGGISGGSYFLHDNNGVAINGDVYQNVGVAIAPAYTGSGIRIILINSSASMYSCTDFAFIGSHSGVPVVNSASIAFNDHRPQQGSYSGPTGTVLLGSSSVMVNPELFSAYMEGIVTYRTAINQFNSKYFIVKFDNNEALGNALEANFATHTINELNNINQYAALYGHGASTINPISVGVAVAYQNVNETNYSYHNLPFFESGLPSDADTQNAVFALFPKAWGTPQYGSIIKIHQISGNAQTVKNIYPSNLYDPPKSHTWYAGSSAHTGYYGPGLTYYSHDPLPNTCIPGDETYIPAAFLNAGVLEELRQDWRFLTMKNYADLKNKYKIEFFDQSYMSYIRGADDGTPQFLDVERCTLGFDGSDNDCDETIVSEREHEGKSTDHIIRPLLPLQTMPAGGNSNLSTMSASKDSETKKVLNKLKPKSKWKPKHKTDAYYDDLVNNKLITMNPDWNIKSCKPTYSASVVAPAILRPNNPSVSPVKPVQKVKPILKMKEERKQTPLKKKE